jgi:hypothetical protein
MVASMQTITGQGLAADGDIREVGGADASDLKALVDDLCAARRTLALLRLRNGIDMLSSEDGEFEQGIRHSATFIQEILDDEMTPVEVEQLTAAATALGVGTPRELG